MSYKPVTFLSVDLVSPEAKVIIANQKTLVNSWIRYIERLRSFKKRSVLFLHIDLENFQLTRMNG